MSKSAARGGIDYSKWDHFGTEDSESDSNEEENVRQMPRVMRLSAPSRVTTSSDTLWIESMSQLEKEKKQKHHQQNKHPTIQPTLETSLPSNASSKSTNELSDLSQNFFNVPQSWTFNGSFIPSHTLYWSQDRYSLSLRFLLPHHVLPKHVAVKWTGKIYKYAERYAAVGSQDTTASFQVLHTQTQQQQPQIIAHGTLPFPIHYSECRTNNDSENNPHDQDGEEEIDWEINYDHNGQRYLHLILPKAFPMPGMTIHWNRPLLEVPICTSDNPSPLPTSQNNSKEYSFAKAWEEAHLMFREKISQAGSISP